MKNNKQPVKYFILYFSYFVFSLVSGGILLQFILSLIDKGDPTSDSLIQFVIILTIILYPILLTIHLVRNSQFMKKIIVSNLYKTLISIFSIILGFLILGYVALKSVRNYPFLLTSISSDTEFKSPQTDTPSDLESADSYNMFTREIEGNVYTLSWLYGDSVAKVSKNEEYVWDTNFPIDQKLLSDFYIYEKGNKLISVIKSEQIIAMYEFVNSYTVSKNSSGGSELNLDFSYMLSPGIYSATRIIDYLPFSNDILLRTSGGDGCGSWGSIWILSANKKRKNVINTAEGCGYFEDPRYLGYFERKIVLAKVVEPKQEDTHGDYENPKYTRIYFLDPITFNENDIIENISSLDKDIFWADISNGQMYFYGSGFKSEDPIYTYNLSSKEFVN